MKKRNLLYIFMLVMAMFAITSCSENDGEVKEFADWQQKNDAYFVNLYATTKEQIAKGDHSWMIIPKYSLPAENDKFHAKMQDYIIVHILGTGNSKSESPLLTDSVKVNYCGRLIPSATFAGGYVFDRSYKGAYNKQTMNPAKFVVSGLVDGFTTALLHMKIGDHWQVYIPYQLGYGNQEQDKGKIPAYSTLIFDIGLVGITR